MVNDAVGLVIMVVLIIIMFLIGIGDLLLALLAGMTINKPKKKKKKKKQEELEEDEILFMQHPGQESPTLRIPNNKMGAFMDGLAAKMKKSGMPTPEDDKKEEKHEPKGYI